MSQWSLVDRFAKLLDQRLPTPEGSWADPKRKLGQAQYLSLFLFTLFNPIVRSMRGICAASHLVKIQTTFGGPPVSLGSFSEAQHLCDPQLLAGIFQDLSARIPTPNLQDPRQQWERWLAQDSSVFSALPQMSWAVYGGGKRNKKDQPNRALRLHLSFNVLSDHPVAAKVTPGKICERAAWKEQWEPGAAYIGDRYYGEDYALLDELSQAGCRYLIRLRQAAVVNVVEELAVSPADQQAGVVRQALATLGARKQKERQVLRVVWVETPTAGTLILATNLKAQADAPGELIAAIYRRRWQIEGFFRWVKCLLGCRHWLAQSQRGVTIQLYLALIGALLMQLFCGQRPNKRMFELFQFYQQGWLETEELIARLEAEKARQRKQKSARR